MLGCFEGCGWRRKMSDRPKVAVSYSWRELKPEEHDQRVTNFCDELTKAGADVVRDSLTLTEGAALKKFMREQIGKAGFLCVFLSEEYLKSHNCMYEFLVAWNRDYEDADALAARMCICSMISRDRLDPPTNRTWLQEHWAKLAVENSTYRDNYINNLAPGTSATIDNISEIHGRVDKMVDFIVDRLQFQTPEAMLDVVKTRLKLDADKRRQRAEVFAKLVEEINRRLGRRKSISELLKSTMPLFFADSKVIPEAVGQISGDEDSLVASLSKFEEELQGRDFPASRDERKDLMEVLGGLVLLTVDPDWVLRHRAAKLAEPIPIPGSDSVMALGETRPVEKSKLACSILAPLRWPIMWRV